MQMTKTFDKGWKAEDFREKLWTMGVAYNVGPVVKTDEGHTVNYDSPGETFRTIREI